MTELRTFNEKETVSAVTHNDPAALLHRGALRDPGQARAVALFGRRAFMGPALARLAERAPGGNGIGNLFKAAGAALSDLGALTPALPSWDPILVRVAVQGLPPIELEARPVNDGRGAPPDGGVWWLLRLPGEPLEPYVPTWARGF